MNNLIINTILEQSALLEENVAKVYLLLSRLFTDDGEFWKQLHDEEQSHAGLFKRFLNQDLPLSLLPDEILDHDLEEIKRNNAFIEEELKGFLSKHKRKSDAYAFALQLEDMSGESIFRQRWIQNLIPKHFMFSRE